MGVTPSYIARGTCGTCSWIIENDGKFTVGAGKLANPSMGLDGETVWPWTSHATDITSADMTAAITTSNSCDSMFKGCSNMTGANLSGIDLSGATSAPWMFYGCSSLASLDVSTWDFSNISYAIGMFLDCGTDSLVLDLSSWDTSGMSNAMVMFTTYGNSEAIAEIGNHSYTGGRIVTGEDWTLELTLPPQNYTTSASYTWHKVTGWETALTECRRCDSSGNDKPDGGEYVSVKATWSMSTIGSAVTQMSTGAHTYKRDDVTPSMTGSVTLNDYSTYSVFTGTLSTSGTAAIIAANLNELDVFVTLTDGSVTKEYTATVQSGIPPLFSAHKSDGVVDGIGIGATRKEGYVNNGFPHAILGQPVPPTFYYATKPAESDLPVTPCIVIQTSDWSVWYCDDVPSYHCIAATGGTSTCAPGVIYPYSGSTAPSGFLMCDGAAVSRTTYAELFTVIGTTYGTGDGSTTFNVPDLRGRTPIGASSGHILGSTGGEESHTLQTNEMPKHRHRLSVSGSNNQGYLPQNSTQLGSILNGGANPSSTNYNGMIQDRVTTTWASTPMMEEIGGSSAHNNMQPFATVNYIISTGLGSGISVDEVVQGITTLPLSVANGGTGANTAAGARSNLGALAASSTLNRSANLNSMVDGEVWWGDGFTNAPDNGWYRVIRIGETQIAFRFTANDTSPRFFIRSYVDSVWQPWAEYSNTNHTHNYITNGTWWSNGSGQNVNNLSNSSAFVYSNHGAIATGTIIDITNRDNTNYRMQLMNQYNTGHLYTRSQNGDNSTWTSWLPILDSGNYSSYALPLSGGTLTGRLAINANGVKSWFGSANNGWVHFSNDQGKSNYFEQSIHCAGDFFIYNAGRVMLRTETDGNGRVNYISGYDYLHITTWQKGNFGVTWWSSDIRLKDNIADSTVDALEVVNQIQHRSFDMKSDGEHHDIGYVAQELEKLDPQMVTKVYQSREVNGRSYFTGDYTYQIDERKVIPYLSRSIQQLSAENDELRAKNAELEARLEAIERKLGL